VTDDRDRLDLLGRRFPPAFEVRVLELGPGRSRPYCEADWRDALVVVERGELELEGLGGRRERFRLGAVLSLAGLGLRNVRNPGAEQAVLVAVSRRMERS
jgi:hypothetical protein